MATQELIDQRLDAVDRALLGLLPRNERLAIVADVESRICQTGLAEVAEALESTAVAEVVASGPARVRRRRSRLALTAGVVGIVALALLAVMPLTYLVVAMLGEAVGEEIVYALLSLNIVVVALGGAAAVVLGITALVRLSRRRGWLGHGWAVTGLCTGPVPALVGGLGVVAFVVPISMQLVSSVSETASCEPAYASVPVSYVPPNALPPAPCVSSCPPVLPPAGSWPATPSGAAPALSNGYASAPVVNPAADSKPPAGYALPPDAGPVPAVPLQPAPQISAPPSVPSPAAPQPDGAPVPPVTEDAPQPKLAPVAPVTEVGTSLP